MGADGEGEPGRGISHSDTLSLCEWFTVSILTLSGALRQLSRRESPWHSAVYGGFPFA